MADSIVKDMLITRVNASASAAQTELLSTTILDMSGYDSVCFIVLLGTATDGSVMTLTVKSNPTSSSSGGTTEKAGTAVTAATSSSKTMAVDVFRPTQRYVFSSFTRTAQNCGVDGVLAIQYNSKNKPTTQGILDAVFAGPNA